MLKTPKQFQFIEDPIINIITNVLGRESGVKVLEEGMVEIGHFSLDMLMWGGNGEWHQAYPQINGVENCYGVCDSPAQFMDKYRKILEADPRTFVVSMTHIIKEPENAGNGGGWRWHKWGPYIGDGEPTCEYLDDEEKFENGVYVYHIYQIDGPIVN